MWPVFPEWVAASALVVALGLVLFAARVVQPSFWRSRAFRLAIGTVFGAALVGLVVWTAGRAITSDRVVRFGAGLAYGGVLIALPGAFVMPIAALVDRALMRIALPKPQTTPDDAITRRALIRMGSASLPTIAALTGARGLVEGHEAPVVRTIRMRFPGLHPDLEGLRILQLSDLHLGSGRGLEDLEHALADAAAHRPDLIVVTGDLADYAPFIPDALRLVARANARYGAFASLGNHEYIHDIDVTRPLFEASAVPLLCGSGKSVRVGRATLFVGGADDPVTMHGDIATLLEPTIRRAASDAPAHADFRLLLCHRPEGHAPAAASGFDLTLAGHTHGGQLGLLGRSLLEHIDPRIGWWGSYAKARPAEIVREREARRMAGPAGPSRLYTTSGFGHWFPFRVGCPTEMALIVLEGEKRAEGIV